MLIAVDNGNKSWFERKCCKSKWLRLLSLPLILLLFSVYVFDKYVFLYIYASRLLQEFMFILEVPLSVTQYVCDTSSIPLCLSSCLLTWCSWLTVAGIRDASVPLRNPITDAPRCKASLALALSFRNNCGSQSTSRSRCHYPLIHQGQLLLGQLDLICLFPSRCLHKASWRTAAELWKELLGFMELCSPWWSL